MKSVKQILDLAYRLALLWIPCFFLFNKVWGEVTWEQAFHNTAFYLPVVASIFCLSFQFDLFTQIVERKEINIKARAIDFIHWLLLISINVSLWMFGGVTIWWLVLQLAMLVLIGAQIGIRSAQRESIFSMNEKVAGGVAASFALLLGSAAGYIRYASPEGSSAGWWLDSITGIVSIVLVVGFITQALSTIRKDWTPYPRKIFLKGVFGCNVMILLNWVSVMSKADCNWSYECWFGQHFGFTFVTIVGNSVYLAFWGMYEFYRAKQEREKRGWGPLMV